MTNRTPTSSEVTDRDATPRHRTALVTGGSRGIGFALAAEFAADGYDLVLVAQDHDRLEAAATQLRTRFGCAVTAMATDLSDPESPQALHDRVSEAVGHVNALVNNAGVATYGPFAESDLAAERDQVRINVEAPVALTRLFLPAMLERDDGMVLTVSSTAAAQPGPMMAGYHASKAYVLSFTESIAEECRETGVTVTALCPGPVSTGIHDRCGRGSTWLERRFMFTPQQVAASGYRAAKRGDIVFVPGYRNRVIPALSRLLPSSLRRRLGHWVATPGVVPRR
ncbi:SDR family oxidoreductase [Halobacteria archaeon AArc-curdl1]|uniref:SDR family oxidoreductase n=1 Tax=Natronosalvus hydrolyticus TaxID=2979988 RepID=A0AAP3E6Z9_9EURY|nr:SDR family oxidoreductase [Halobacteria archaeon AArc-curdl1]